jgi:hypothetical protein
MKERPCIPRWCKYVEAWRKNEARAKSVGFLCLSNSKYNLLPHSLAPVSLATQELSAISTFLPRNDTCKRRYVYK